MSKVHVALTLPWVGLSSEDLTVQNLVHLLILLLRFSSVVWMGTVFDNHANKNHKKDKRLVL